MTSWENQKGLHLHNISCAFLDAGEAQDDFWSISGDCICRHHVEPKVKLYTPREDSCSILLKYIDVTRATHTPWMYCKKAASTIIGTLMCPKICPTYGQVSHKSPR